MPSDYILGDHYVQCDRSGQKALRSHCVREWDGAIVKREFAEARHPLDLQRPPPTERSVQDARPVNEIELNYGDVTADDL
jgi:hypothetical protein